MFGHFQWISGRSGGSLIHSITILITTMLGSSSRAPGVYRMCRYNLREYLFRTCAALALLFSFAYAPAGHAQTQVCFPTCDVTDSRMVVVAGPNLSTLTDQTVNFQLIVFEDATTLEFGIFDGDATGPWDIGPNLPLTFELMADPNGDGSGSGGLLQTWSGNDMVDNDWFDTSRPIDASAQTTSGAYSYTLRVTPAPNPTNATFNNGFKVRTVDGIIQIRPQVFSYIANLTDGTDAGIIYNGQFVDESDTTYDGTFTFYLHVPQILDEIIDAPPDRLGFWDGDFDHGSSDGSTLDSDDPNTDSTIPAFAAGSSAVPEGAQGIGDPADDVNVAFFTRSPSTYYELIPPGSTAGNGFLNPNPSGDEEWERFTVSVDNADNPDVLVTDALEKGVYEFQISGVDLFNLQSVRFDFALLCVQEDGSPCVPVECPLDSNLEYVDGECVPPEEECVECEGGVTSMTIAHDRDENDVHMRVWEYINGGWSVILNTESSGDPMVAAGEGVSFDVSDGADWVAVQIKDNVGHYNWFTKGKIRVDCSDAVGAGATFGEYPDYIAFEVLESESEAGLICPIDDEPQGDPQGCTPGYWKQFHHLDDWVGVNWYDSFDAIFGVNAGGITMWDALTTGGGGLDALNRHAAAAYLNASSPDVNYAEFPTPEQVVALVQDAYNGGDVEGSKDLLDQLNNAGCPLGNGGGGDNDNNNDNGNHNGNSNSNDNSGHGGYGNSNRSYGNSNRYGGYSSYGNSNRSYGNSNRYGGYSSYGNSNRSYGSYYR